MNGKTTTMKHTLLLAILLCALYPRQQARAHGDPILVGVNDNQLMISQPTGTFPPLIFGQGGSAGLPNEDVSFLPGPGEIVYWDLPGLEINGLSDSSGLSIEPLARPVIGSPTNEVRWVWYWNPATNAVQTSPVDIYLLGVAPRYATLSATNAASPAPFVLADPIAGQQGFHNHGLLNYAIDNSLGAPSGIYGFFSRFVSSEHQPSDAFLLILNHGVASTDVVPAAAAIWTAANSLPGDFNHDGTVDAADYTIWRNGLGTDYTPDQYTEWKTHFGESIGNGQGAVHVSTAVPEPATVMLVLFALTCGANAGVRRKRASDFLSRRTRRSKTCLYFAGRLQCQLRNGK